MHQTSWSKQNDFTPVAENKPLSRGSHAEFRLEQTSLDISKGLTVQRSSDGMGWTGLHATLVEEYPHETTHREISDIWLSTALKVRDLDRTIGTVRQHAIIPVGRTVITGAGITSHDIIGTESLVLHVFLRHSIVAEVARELAIGGVHGPEIPSVFPINDPGLNQILNTVRETLHEPAQGAGLKIDYIARALAAHLLCHHSVHGHTSPQLRPSQQLSARQLRSVLDYIEENLAANIAIADLAEVTGLSKVHFIRKFKASTQQTPYQYVVSTRVKKAKQLLSAPQAEFANIAVSCGFADQAHFSNCFKRVVGTSPSNYRRGTL